MMSSGIYQIRNTLDGKYYIGSAVNLRQRWLRHLGSLRHGEHFNPHLQNAFDKSGEGAFIFDVLEYVEDSEMLLKHEQYYLDMLLPEYNISPTAGSTLGCHPTEETCTKISAATIGKRRSVETHAKISKANTGSRHPMYGKHPNAETRQKMAAAKTGKYHSTTTRMKMSKAKTGERNPNYGKSLSEETRAKISVAQLGRQFSAETCAKISAAKMGNQNQKKQHSMETKRKISEASKAYWRRVREAKENLNDKITP